ncbi:GNAT family N-acetyltransferase [Catenulispora subtropica]|uniref:GNAT family N-acetyltransferase n=1 Tax=Catenulispora subtropica TaxID=450798 RepID=UPI003CD08C3E
MVVGEPPVGFARIELLDDTPHLEQLSVHPTATRQGLGTALIQACCHWATQHGYDQITLTTFAEVPFNAPTYQRLGFTPIPQNQLPPHLAARRRHETETGLDALRPRIAMRHRI